MKKLKSEYLEKSDGVVVMEKQRPLKKRSSFSRSETKLGTQITYLVAISLLIMVASVSLVTSFITSQSLTNDFIRDGENIAKVLAEQAAIPVLVGSPEGARQALELADSFVSVSYVAVYERNGNMLSDIGDVGDQVHQNKNLMFSITETRMEADTKVYWQYISPVFSDTAEPELEDQEATRVQQEVIGLVRVRIDKGQLYSVRDNIIIGNTLVLSFVAALLLISLRWLSIVLTQPLEEFVETMRSGARGDEASLRIQLSGSQETVQLSDSFNRMMLVLEDREVELAAARDQAVAAAMLKSEFAANVSHEIRTPLNGIVGTLDLLSQSKLDDEQREYIALAESASEALVRMINDILEFSRLSLDEITVARTAFDLRTLLEELVALHSKSRNARSLDMLLYYDPQLTDIVESDPNKIRQLLNNLINNAVKFTHEGSIEVKAEKEIDADGRVWVRVAVQDTGIGLNENDLRKIFLPYAQSDGTMSRKYSGTGLGLAISERISALLHGDIGVNSELGVGSEFFVRIPFTFKEGLRKAAPYSVHNAIEIYIYSNNASICDALQNLCELESIKARSFTELEHLDKALEQSNSEILLLLQPSFLCDNYEFWYTLKPLERKASKVLRLTNSLTFSESISNDFIVMLPPLRSVGLHVALGKLCQLDSIKNENKNFDSLRLDFVDKRILLVEDNPINQRVSRAMLTKSGFDVEVAENGLEALDYVKNEKFDLILMDCQMPKMDGYEATRAIRGLDDERSTLPIIAMTANIDKEDQLRCYETGMNDFIAKPMTLVDLNTVLLKWISSDYMPVENSE